MAPQRRIVDGDSDFSFGANSGVRVMSMRPGQYVEAVNMVSQGGVLHSRPGSEQRITYPKGIPQGAWEFAPTLGSKRMIVAIEGRIYTSTAPFQKWELLEGARLNSKTTAVHGVLARQVVERNEDGSLRFIDPRTVLILQDGHSAPLIYDGLTLRASVDDYAIPVGTCMVFSNSRLWVVSGDKLFASDIGDPTQFREQATNWLGGMQYFLLPGKGTGIIESAGLEVPQIIVFTRDSFTFVRSDIRDRNAWAATPQFMHTINGVGCVAPKSLVAHNGSIWWMGRHGVVNLDVAVAANTSSRIVELDRPMASSKRGLSQTIEDTCAATHGNYLLFSVPAYGSKNRHTWVIDSTVSENGIPIWSGIWTGHAPVQWVGMSVLGSQKLYALSADPDGTNRLWEFFQGRRDNGVDIPWGVVTRAYVAETLAPKRFRYADIHLADMLGTVDVSVLWAGVSRGRYKNIATRRFHATEGSLRQDAAITEDTKLFALIPQNRVMRTADVEGNRQDTLSSCGVDSEFLEWEDLGHQITVLGSGIASIQTILVYMDPVVEPDSGRCGQDEEPGPDRARRFDGASGSVSELEGGDVTYTGEGTEVATVDGETRSFETTVVGVISEAEATKRAAQAAMAQRDYWVEQNEEPTISEV